MSSRLIDEIRRFLRIHVHKRKTFCVGEVAFVKCVDCGAESLPWRVPKATADEWKRANPTAIIELLDIDRRSNA